ncbi:MAG: hypothetical protein ACD_9C00311G0003 [uncultured bacterium]|nr:MAG: hypothetical protein ACD_9C00311G0003 [uncultured bacterium]
MNQENDAIFLKTMLPKILISESSYKYFFVGRSRDISFKGSPNKTERIDSKSRMEIKSPVFGNNEMIPKKYTCDGENINPPLEISGVKVETQSLVLIMHDQDAPISGGWTHWTLMNISPDTTEIKEDNVPDNSKEGQTSSGVAGYGGPCPPSGTHHYEFRLYALDTNLVLDESAKKVDIEHAMEGHIVEYAVLIGLYSRAI